MAVAAPPDADRWKILGVLCLCVVVIGVDNTILNVALPSIVRSLDASGAQLQWMVDAYTIVFACLLLTAGALGDRYGRRGALVLGLLWFGACSGLASLAQSPIHLVIARGLMGIGGAFIFPTTLSALSNAFTEPEERSRAIGIWAGVSGIGVAVGPLAGGLLVEHLSWHAVFWVNIPICAAAALLVVRYLPSSVDRGESPLDPAGAFLSIAGLCGLLYAIIEAPNGGWTAPGVVAGLTIGGVLLGAFAWWENRTEDPMLDVRFFQNPRFSAASATITIVFFAMFASTFIMTQYFQFILGYSPLKAGMMIAPVALGLLIGSPLAPRLVTGWGTKRVVMLGLVIMTVGFACYASDTIMSSFAVGVIVRFVYGIGMGMTSSPLTESIMGSLPPERAGVGSAVNDTTRQVGGALGVAVLGSVFGARYHRAVDASAAVPIHLRDDARESIGATLRVARQAPDALGSTVRDVGVHAFLTSMRLTFAIGAAIVGAAIFVAYRFVPAHAIDMEQRVDDALHESLLTGAENNVN
jgi:EmrB/QacA subfamily drug resistance transporter